MGRDRQTRQVDGDSVVSFCFVIGTTAATMRAGRNRHTTALWRRASVASTRKKDHPPTSFAARGFQLGVKLRRLASSVLCPSGSSPPPSQRNERCARASRNTRRDFGTHVPSEDDGCGVQLETGLKDSAKWGLVTSKQEGVWCCPTRHHNLTARSSPRGTRAIAQHSSRHARDCHYYMASLTPRSSPRGTRAIARLVPTRARLSSLLRRRSHRARHLTERARSHDLSRHARDCRHYYGVAHTALVTSQNASIARAGLSAPSIAVHGTSSRCVHTARGFSLIFRITMPYGSAATWERRRERGRRVRGESGCVNHSESPSSEGPPGRGLDAIAVRSVRSGRLEHLE